MRLGQVAIVVPDYDEAIDYYVNKLEFSLVEDSDLGGGKRWVVVAPDVNGGANFLLAKADGVEQEKAIGNQLGGRVGFFVYTDSFDADYARLLKKDVDFTELPRDEAFGKVVVFRDRYGNLFDLIQRP